MGEGKVSDAKQPSISSRLYARFFRTKNNCATFSGYVLALAKDFGAKNMLSYEKRALKIDGKTALCL
jgi:hypothetical protein